MATNYIVTIDGPAGAGKSTVARQLADRLGIEFLDTGAGYRAIALLLQRRGFDESLCDAHLGEVLASFNFAVAGSRFLLNGEDVTATLRDPAVTNLAGRIADKALVRARLTQWQQEYAWGRSLVTEGRDQGTQVFPDALCKFFLTANEAARIERRYRDLLSRGIDIEMEEVAAAQRDRDRRDLERSLAPLRPAEDATLLDSTALSPQQVVEVMERRVRERLAELSREGS